MTTRLYDKSIMKQFVSSAATTHDKFQILCADAASYIRTDWLAHSLIELNLIEFNWIGFNLIYLYYDKSIG